MAEPRTCAVPGCDRTLYPRNWTGVCRAHNHAAGFCGCAQCSPESTPPQKPGPYRVRTRDELVNEGLLPERPVFSAARRKPGMPQLPSEDADG